MFTDMTLPDLQHYTGSQVEPADFDEFWLATLESARRDPVLRSVTPTDSGLVTLDVYDVRFGGFDGEEIAAWLRMPKNPDGRLPAIVQYHGYGRGRGEAHENLLWASAGFAHFEMDSRGQGWMDSCGVTPDSGAASSQVPGFATRGIDHPERYYYRRLFTDAVRAVEAVRALDGVDPTRIVVHGASQGGGIALAVAGLVPELAHAVIRVPFLCDFLRAITITDQPPYREITDYLAHNREKADQVLRTLSYFDGVNFARRATTAATFTVALMDPVCPPSTVFAAHNAYAGPKKIRTWTYNGHEGGGKDDDLLALDVMRRLRISQ